LSKDAIRPGCYRSWIWPRDPEFEQKAARVLGLYHGFWEDKPLNNNDFIISSDEKTCIQARRRVAPVTAPKSGLFGRVEHEYEKIAKPFKWKFTRDDLKKILAKFGDSLKMAA
jgi:hypothetical protein